MSGSLGWLNTPVAPITNRAVSCDPSERSIRHALASSSKLAPVTFVFSRNRSRTPYFSTQWSA